jgi:hypothetical protein
MNYRRQVINVLTTEPCDLVTFCDLVAFCGLVALWPCCRAPARRYRRRRAQIERSCPQLTRRSQLPARGEYSGAPHSHARVAIHITLRICPARSGVALPVPGHPAVAAPLTAASQM